MVSPPKLFLYSECLDSNKSCFPVPDAECVQDSRAQLFRAIADFEHSSPSHTFLPRLVPSKIPRKQLVWHTSEGRTKTLPVQFPARLELRGYENDLCSHDFGFFSFAFLDASTLRIVGNPEWQIVTFRLKYAWNDGRVTFVNKFGVDARIVTLELAVGPVTFFLRPLHPQHFTPPSADAFLNVYPSPQ